MSVHLGQVAFVWPDPSSRYFPVAGKWGKNPTGAICYQSFKLFFSNHVWGCCLTDASVCTTIPSFFMPCLPKLYHPLSPSINLYERPLTQLTASFWNLLEILGGLLGKKNHLGSSHHQQCRSFELLFLVTVPDMYKHTLFGVWFNSRPRKCPAMWPGLKPCKDSKSWPMGELPK